MKKPNTACHPSVVHSSGASAVTTDSAKISTLPRPRVESRFTVSKTETRHGNPTYLVQGYLRGGKRVRERFADQESARARCNELEAQHLGRDSGATLRLTRLSPVELGIAEAAFLRMENPRELKLAVDHWVRFGRHFTGDGPTPSLAVAVKAFCEWMESEDSDLREKTRIGYVSSLDLFRKAMGDVPLTALHPDSIDHALRTRWPKNATSRHQTRRVVSRFCSWCMQRPRRWLATNPASGKLIATRPGFAMRESEPEVYSLREVMRLLAAARRYRGGKYLRFIVLSLFAGLRPAEAIRVRANQPNLVEGELRIEAAQSKVGRARTVQLPDVAVAWLRICPEGGTANTQNSRKFWGEYRKMTKVSRWHHDGLRHTAVSYHFRAQGSYGLTAEWAGNSENIIKTHYQGRVTRAESDLFWTLFPDRNVRRLARQGIARKVAHERQEKNVLHSLPAAAEMEAVRLTSSETR